MDNGEWNTDGLSEMRQSLLDELNIRNVIPSTESCLTCRKC
jgi:hypothetical protein